MKNCRVLFNGKLSSRKYFTFENARKYIRECINLGFGEYQDYSIKQY